MAYLSESRPNKSRIANTWFCYEKSGRSKSRVEKAGNLRRAGARRNWLRHDAERRTTPENKKEKERPAI